MTKNDKDTSALADVARKLRAFRAELGDTFPDIARHLSETAERAEGAEPSTSELPDGPSILEIRLRLARCYNLFPSGVEARVFRVCYLDIGWALDEDTGTDTDADKPERGGYSHDVRPEYEYGIGSHAVPHVDEGYQDSDDSVYVARCEFGILGTVRAQSWEGAWEAMSDSLSLDADPNDVSTYRVDYDATVSDADLFELAEGHEYRSNGEPTNGLRSSFLTFTRDTVLDKLTPELADLLELRPIVPGSANWQPLDG